MTTPPPPTPLLYIFICSLSPLWSLTPVPIPRVHVCVVCLPTSFIRQMTIVTVASVAIVPVVVVVFIVVVVDLVSRDNGNGWHIA